MTHSAMPALPPADLRDRVAGTPDDRWFWKSGADSVADIEAMLAIAGKSFADFPRALDFGCGCGRMLLHLGEVGARIELHGVDIDPAAIAWVQANIAWTRCGVNDGLPPLAFPDAHFDLVFNHSVFTHLDERYQDAWLGELRRVVKPGGHLVLTIAGEHLFAELVKTHRDAGVDPAPLLRAFREEGVVFIEDDGWKGGPFPDFYHSAFHAPWYVFEHWGRFLEVEAYVVRGALGQQDSVLLRRPEAPSATDILHSVAAGASPPSTAVAQAPGPQAARAPKASFLAGIAGRWRQRTRGR